MQITLNGKPKQLDSSCNVSQLLQLLEFPAQQVAVEVNEQIVRRAQHATTLLNEGDVVEVVTLVGGG